MQKQEKPIVEKLIEYEVDVNAVEKVIINCILTVETATLKHELFRIKLLHCIMLQKMVVNPLQTF